MSRDELEIQLCLSCLGPPNFGNLFKAPVELPVSIEARAMQLVLVEPYET